MDLRNKAMEELKKDILEEAAIDVEEEGLALSQANLSRMVEAKNENEWRRNTVKERDQAHLGLTWKNGVGAWLTTYPTCEDTVIELSLFRIAVRKRLETVFRRIITPPLR